MHYNSYILFHAQIDIDIDKYFNVPMEKFGLDPCPSLWNCPTLLDHTLDHIVKDVASVHGSSIY